MDGISEAGGFPLEERVAERARVEGAGVGLCFFQMQCGDGVLTIASRIGQWGSSQRLGFAPIHFDKRCDAWAGIYEG